MRQRRKVSLSQEYKEEFISCLRHVLSSLETHSLIYLWAKIMALTHGQKWNTVVRDRARLDFLKLLLSSVFFHLINNCHSDCTFIRPYK